MVFLYLAQPWDFPSPAVGLKSPVFVLADCTPQSVPLLFTIDLGYPTKLELPMR